MNKLFLSALVVIFSSAVPAFASSLGIEGLMNMTNYSGSNSPSGPEFNGRTNFGGGFFIRGSEPATFQVDFLYAPRRLNDSVVGDFTYNMLEIPVMLRFTAIPLISFGAGGYLAQRLGEISGIPPNNKSLGTTDFGLIAAAGLEFPFGPMGFLIEARYLFGLADMGGEYGTLHWRNWEAVAGLRFSF